MILSGSRIVAAGVLAAADHVLRGPKNDVIRVLAGTEADLLDAAADARANGDRYALRHWKVSPAGPMSRQDLRNLLADLAAEFGADPQRFVVIEHRKPRSDANPDAGVHWHVLAPERLASGRIMCSRQSFARHERIARSAELRLGHRLVNGRHALAVANALKATDEAGARQLMDLASAEGSPAAAFTSAQRGAFERRTGLDLPQVRAAVAQAHARSDGARAFKAALDEMGLQVRRGDRGDCWVLEQDGVLVGALHRMVGLRAAEVRTYFGAAGRSGAPDRCRHLLRGQAWMKAEMEKIAAERDCLGREPPWAEVALRTDTIGRERIRADRAAVSAADLAYAAAAEHQAQLAKRLFRWPGSMKQATAALEEARDVLMLAERRRLDPRSVAFEVLVAREAADRRRQLETWQRGHAALHRRESLIGAAMRAVATGDPELRDVFSRDGGFESALAIMSRRQVEASRLEKIAEAKRHRDARHEDWRHAEAWCFAQEGRARDRGAHHHAEGLGGYRR